MKARTLGPCLLIALGVAVLLVPGASSVGAGSNNPCPPANTGAVANAAIVDPCPTTTVAPEPTTTLPQPTTTAPEPEPTTIPVDTSVPTVPTTIGEVPTTDVVETLPEPETTDPDTTPDPTPDTEPADIAGADDDRPSGGTQGRALARTGSDNFVLTIFGVAMIGIGMGLLVLGRRTKSA